MGRMNSGLRWGVTSACVVAAAVLQPFFIQSVQAITASVGQPYHGRLVNGIPFPNQFPGYQLREEGRTYTTPEVVGALLDAIDSVREKFPDTCDLYLGDFSLQGGGGSAHHRSHQNGRDVDLGMYHRGNQRLSTLHVMNSENLDAAKTWRLVEGLIRSQRVQYIFLDRSVQRVLYDYALSHGVDQGYLSQLFANAKGSVFQHVRNHIDHMHVRFFTPWSTLAAHIDESETQKLAVVEMAQQAYLPKRVNYYVNGTEPGLDALARSFGVTGGDLCRWNQIRGNTVLPPGSCLVFYKRNFEAEPVHLAQSLQPYAAPIVPVRLASLNPEPVGSAAEAVVLDAPVGVSEPAPRARKSQSSASAVTYSTYKVRWGDTLDKVARRNGIDVKTLCLLNGMKKPVALKPGRTIRVASVKPSRVSSGFSTAAVPTCSINTKVGRGVSGSKEGINICTVGKGDTLDKVAKRHSIKIETLCQLNGLRKSAALHPGQQLNLSKPDKSGKSAKSVLKQTYPVSSANGLKSRKAEPIAQAPAVAKSSQPNAGKSAVKAKPATAPKASAKVSAKASAAPAGKSAAKSAQMKASVPARPSTAVPSTVKKSPPAVSQAKNGKQTSKRGVN